MRGRSRTARRSTSRRSAAPEWLVGEILRYRGEAELLEPPELRPRDREAGAVARPRARRHAPARPGVGLAVSTGSSSVKVAPCPGTERTSSAAAVRLGDRARDEQAEAGTRLAAARRGHARTSRRSARAARAGCPGPWSWTETSTRPFSAQAFDLAPPRPACEYLTAFSTRFVSTWLEALPVGRGRAAASAGALATTATSSWPRPTLATVSRTSSPRSTSRERVRERARLDPGGVEHVADQRRQPVRLVGDQGEERRALLGGQLAPALLERPARRRSPPPSGCAARGRRARRSRRAARRAAAAPRPSPARPRRRGCSGPRSRPAGRAARPARSRRRRRRRAPGAAGRASRSAGADEQRGGDAGAEPESRSGLAPPGRR